MRKTALAAATAAMFAGLLFTSPTMAQPTIGFDVRDCINSDICEMMMMPREGGGWIIKRMDGRKTNSAAAASDAAAACPDPSKCSYVLFRSIEGGIEIVPR